MKMSVHAPFINLNWHAFSRKKTEAENLTAIKIVFLSLSQLLSLKKAQTNNQFLQNDTKVINGANGR